jgi:nucleotide-binding universal stress UspA family protein
VVWYAVYARSRVVGEGLLREALRPTLAEPYRVVVPVSNPETQRDLIRLAAASARANADAGEPELVAVNVVHVEHPSPLQNVESDRFDHQRDLLAAAQQFAEEMDVHLRTRAVVAPDTGAAILDVLEEEDADELLVGWDGVVDADGPVVGPMLEGLVENAPCDVVLVALRGAVGTPVGVVTPDTDASAVARRVAEFATVDGTVPTLLAVESMDAGDGNTRGVTAFVSDLAETADLEADEYAVEVVETESELGDALSRYDTVCVGLEGVTNPRVVQVVRDTSANVALVRGWA